MLDLLRKKARSWVTYLLFGGIIVSFALFFGYNDLQQGSSRDVVATVDGATIGRGEYEFAFENTAAYYREIFKDGIPEQFMEGLRQSTLQQLIGRKLFVKMAREHGFVVTDQELAGHIQSLPFLQNSNNQFDPIAYREQILPALAQQYQLNFEVWAREGLLAQHVRDAIAASVYISDDELLDAYQREQTRYTFEVVRFHAEELVKANKLPDVAAAKDAAITVQAVMDNLAARKPLLATYGVSPETVGPLTVGRELPFLGPAATPADTQALFALRSGTRCPGPYQVDGTWLACRLLKKDTPTPQAMEQASTQMQRGLEERYQQVVLEHWMQHLTADAKITRSL